MCIIARKKYALIVTITLLAADIEILYKLIATFGDYTFL
jgi:hypothetical protein